MLVTCTGACRALGLPSQVQPSIAFLLMTSWATDGPCPQSVSGWMVGEPPLLGSGKMLGHSGCRELQGRVWAERGEGDGLRGRGDRCWGAGMPGSSSPCPGPPPPLARPPRASLGPCPLCTPPLPDRPSVPGLGWLPSPSPVPQLSSLCEAWPLISRGETEAGSGSSPASLGQAASFLRRLSPSASTLHLGASRSGGI